MKRYSYRQIGLDILDISVLSLNCVAYAKGFSIFLKDILNNLHKQDKKKPRAYINFDNDETKAQKSLILTQKPNRFAHKHYKGRWILKFEFVFNNK